MTQWLHNIRAPKRRYTVWQGIRHPNAYFYGTAAELLWHRLLVLRLPGNSLYSRVSGLRVYAERRTQTNPCVPGDRCSAGISAERYYFMKKLDQFLHTLFWVAPGMFAGFALPPSPRRRLFPIKNAEASVFTPVSASFFMVPSPWPPLSGQSEAPREHSRFSACPRPEACCTIPAIPVSPWKARRHCRSVPHIGRSFRSRSEAVRTGSRQGIPLLSKSPSPFY